MVSLFHLKLNKKKELFFGLKASLLHSFLSSFTVVRTRHSARSNEENDVSSEQKAEAHPLHKAIPESLWAKSLCD